MRMYWSSAFGPSLRASRGDPERRLTARVPPCSRSAQRKSGTARGKASASLAKQLERIARSGVSHIVMDTQNVIGRWCGARCRSGLTDASRGQSLFDGGAGFAGLRGRPSPSPEGRSGPSPAEGPRRFRPCRSRPAGAFLLVSSLYGLRRAQSSRHRSSVVELGNFT